MATEITREELISEANRRLLKATGENSAQITERVAENIAGEWYGLPDCSDNALMALLVQALHPKERGEASELRGDHLEQRVAETAAKPEE